MLYTYRSLVPALFLMLLIWLIHQNVASAAEEAKPISLKTMGSLFFGGIVTKADNGETFHGDHGYAQYYIPQNSRNLPMVMWHGIGQSGRSFESTPDGREGFQAILPRNDWSVYIIDQPRRGRAGRTQSLPLDDSTPTTSRESGVWNAFRLGRWLPPAGPTFFPGVQIPHDAYTIDQFMRQQTGDTGALPRTPEYRAFMGNTVKDLFEQAGSGILITHSNSGQFGWATGMAAPDLVKAIVAYEPGQHAFPEGERPAEVTSSLEQVNTIMQPQMVPLEEFKKLTLMPILLVYGDNIAAGPSQVFNEEVWRLSFARARQFVEAINRHGGDAQLMYLPDLGLKGNTHAAFADLNNIEIADLLEKWLAEKKLDGRDQPHQGPAKKDMALTVPMKQ